MSLENHEAWINRVYYANIIAGVYQALLTPPSHIHALTRTRREVEKHDKKPPSRTLHEK